MTTPSAQRIKVSSPEKVARVLDLVCQSGLPLIIRSTIAPGVAVRARALPKSPHEPFAGVKAGNISDRGIQHLGQYGRDLFQVEFILKSEKVQFFCTLQLVNRQFCLFSMPTFIESIERRKNTRLQVRENLQSYLSFQRWKTDFNDPLGQPMFESAIEFASMVPIVDMSVGGAGLSFRFPSILRDIEVARAMEPAELCLPLMAPTSLDVSVRWNRRVQSKMTSVDGGARVLTHFKVGVQFLNLSEKQVRDIEVYMQRLNHADAI